LLLIVLVVAGMIAGYVAMGYANARREWIGAGKPTLTDALKKGVRLGLDLRGGIHLVLQVNTIDAVKAERDDAAEQLQTQAREQGLTLGPAEFPTERSFAIAVTPATDERKLDETVKRYLPDWAVATAGGKWVFTLKDLPLRQMEDNSVSQAVETIRNRIDEFGVAEPLIARQGKDRILVQLPGIDDPKRVKDLIKSTAFLELKLVTGGPSTDRAGLLAPTAGQVPPNLELVEGAVTAGQREPTYYLVQKTAVITGRDLKNARPTQRQLGGNAVSFFLNAAGAEKFAKATG
jgi:preprotein translocase subunit SecD